MIDLIRVRRRSALTMLRFYQPLGIGLLIGATVGHTAALVGSMLCLAAAVYYQRRSRRP